MVVPKQSQFTKAQWHTNSAESKLGMGFQEGLETKTRKQKELQVPMARVRHSTMPFSMSKNFYF
jgi:hypothetical protein